MESFSSQAVAVRPRKRKNTAPRYNPYQPTGIGSKCFTADPSDLHDMFSEGDASHLSAATNECLTAHSHDSQAIRHAPSITSALPSSYATTNTSSSSHCAELGPSLTAIPVSHASVFESPIVSSDDAALSQRLHGSLSSITVAERPLEDLQSVADKSNVNSLSSERFTEGAAAVSDRDTGLPPPCGPFVTHSQSELMPTLPPHYDIDYQLSAQQFADSFVGDSVSDLSNMLAEQGIPGNIGDVSLFADVPPAHTLGDLRMPVRAKNRKKKSSLINRNAGRTKPFVPELAVTVGNLRHTIAST